MKVVILAAGRGKRMGEYTETTTKAMLPMKSDDGHKYSTKPMLEITIERFIQCGFDDFIIVVGYRKNDIISHFGDGSSRGINIKYVTQKHVCSGTADAVACAQYFFDYDPEIVGASGDVFFLVFGDVIPSTTDINNIFYKYIDTPSPNGDPKYTPAVMGVRRVPDPQRYGVVETDDLNMGMGNVIRIVEKSPNPPSNLINAGIYIFPTKIFDHIKKTTLSVRGEYELTDSIQMLIDSGVNVKYESVGGIQDIGTKDIYEKCK
jgi:bifunctional UDP-N-acetylglucosamine pyrophosphorylase/glucosamine-1-phosphate N-acetyltransferase